MIVFKVMTFAMMTSRALGSPMPSTDESRVQATNAERSARLRT